MDILCKIIGFGAENWKDIIIFVTFLALGYQLIKNTKAIKLSTEANELTKNIIKKNTQIRELELMPKKHFIIHTQVLIEGYIQEIDAIVSVLKEIQQNPSDDKLVDKISKLYRSKGGLLQKHTNKPNFLIEIEESATQYYYNLVCNMSSFKKGDGGFNKLFVIDMLNRTEDSRSSIRELLGYVEGMMPEVILNCPASINERDFY